MTAETVAGRSSSSRVNWVEPKMAPINDQWPTQPNKQVDRGKFFDF
jgi:hypothetical protein